MIIARLEVVNDISIMPVVVNPVVVDVVLDVIAVVIMAVTLRFPCYKIQGLHWHFDHGQTSSFLFFVNGKI